MWFATFVCLRSYLWVLDYWADKISNLKNSGSGKWAAVMYISILNYYEEPLYSFSLLLSAVSTYGDNNRSSLQLFHIITGKTTLAATQSNGSPFSPCSPHHPHLLPLPWRYIASHIHANESQPCSARDTLPLLRRYFSSSRSNNRVIITKCWDRGGC